MVTGYTLNMLNIYIYIRYVHVQYECKCTERPETRQGQWLTKVTCVEGSGTEVVSLRTVTYYLYTSLLFRFLLQCIHVLSV